MKMIVATQEDSAVIPRNIERLLAVEDVSIELIVTLDSKGALENRKWYFLKGFGPRQGIKMASILLTAKLADALDALCGYRLLKAKRSVKALARRNRIPFLRTTSPNGQAFLDRIRKIAPDLIVSFSAPCVFGADLLAIPKLGCINLHCSRLPDYAGLLPSFWTLYNGEQRTGATVHYMDTEIDNGAILDQEDVFIESGMTMYELIRRTKRKGGELVERTIRALQAGTAQTRKNNRQEGRYFSWPTVEQMIEFRRRGGRLV